MRRVLVFTVTMAVMLALAAPAGAAPPSEVEFEVQTSFAALGGPFIASGPAVDAGLVCDEGDVEEVFRRVSGSRSIRNFNIQIVNEFTCDDGTGTFLVKLQVHVVLFSPSSFTWTVVGGTGDYVDLRGAGSGDGIPGVPCGDVFVCILDLYDGKLR